MKTFANISLFIVLLAVSIIAQPKIEFSEENYDFGNINQGDVVSHEYVIKNEGTENLILENIKATCGCTAAQPDKRELNPGESTKLKVTFDSAGRKGIQKKYVYVFSNDTERPQVRLSFVTKILFEGELDAKVVKEPQIALSKKEIDFGNVIQGEIKSDQINVMNRGKTDLHIKGVVSTVDFFELSISKQNLKPGEVASISVKFNSKDLAGVINTSITILSSDKVRQQENIIVTANVIKGEES